MTTPRTTITRYPNGQWMAIGSVPWHGGVFAVKELVHEGPLRQEAIRRLSRWAAPRIALARQRQAMGGDISTHGAGISGAGVDPIACIIQVARRAVAVMTNRRVREELMARLGAKIQSAVTMLEEVQARSQATQNAEKGLLATATAVSGFSDDQRLHVVVGELIGRLEAKDESAFGSILETAQKVQTDKGAFKIMCELIAHATTRPAGQVLYDLFLRSGLPKLAGITAKQRQLHLERGAAR